MSSNAFARSRPRVRHQRVPKSHSHAHPRFLQLVRELERLDAVKKKQEHIEGDLDGGNNSGCDNGIVSNGGNCSTTAVTINLPVIAECCSSAQNSSNRTICCGNVDEAQTSNGCRTLGCNHSTSALNDNYYRQNHNHQNNHHHNNHQPYSLHHSTSNNHVAHHQHNYREPNQLSNTSMHQHQDDRCPSKCSSGIATNFGYSKQSLAEQNSSDFSTSNNNLDLRQDENRSKRKRSSNDSSSSSSKKLPTTSSCGTSSKRHKSSPEPVRPLSPSFTKCPICLLDCMDRDPSFTNTCFHLFCYVCIENWTKNKATCPLCRTKFTKIIYNIRSESCYEEKIASPIRRDEDDDRIIYDQLQGLNTNQIVSNRNPNNDDPRLLFDNLRNSDVLMQPFAFVNHIDPRQDSINSFNATTTAASFNASVPHPPFTNYNPIGPNYLLIPSGNSRLQQLAASNITSAFTSNASLSSNNGDPSRVSRVPRSGRYTLTRNYADLSMSEGSPRVSRVTSSSLNQPVTNLPLERQHIHHHHQHQHPSHHQHHSIHNQHRSTSIEINNRQGQRMEHPHIHMPHVISPRYYNPSVYSRRPYTNPPIEQHILDNLYRQMPDI